MKRLLTFSIVLSILAVTPSVLNAGVHELGVTAGYAFNPYPVEDQGPAAGLYYCYYFLEDLGLKLTGMAKWFRPVQADGTTSADLNPAFQGGAGLQYVVDIDTIIEPFLGAGANFYYGDLGQGNNWAAGAYIGAGISHTFNNSLRVGLELDYFYPFNARDSLPSFMMIQLEFSLLLGTPSETISRI